MKRVKLIILSIFFLAFLAVIPTLGKYISNEVKNYYLSSKNFYFNSDKLEPNGIVYQVENWSGVDSYEVTFNMNSYKNNNVYSEVDISYDIIYTCSSNVTCTISKNDGVIFATDHTDSFSVIVTPITPLNDGEKAWIEVETTSTSPYKKTLKGKFNIAVGKMGLSYEINDEVGKSYFEVAVTNTLDYYVVRTAFDKYSVGDKIDINTYQALTEEEKNNFASAIVNISFSPEVALLDMTSKAYLDALETKTEEFNGYTYINKLSFKVDALSSSNVKFYKVNSNNDYTYPFGGHEPIVDIEFE